MHKKCKILTYARAPNANCLSPQLIGLLKQEKTDRHSWFDSTLMPILRNRDEAAFTDFSYTADFVEQFCNMTLTASSNEDWWDCFVGHQLHRNADEIRDLNRMFSDRRDPHIQFQVTPNQLGKLRSKAPLPITEMAELLNFLKRISGCASLFFPQLSLGHTARALHKALLPLSRKLATDRSWLRTKPSEIIYLLIKEQDAEFALVMAENTLLSDDHGETFVPTNTAQFTAMCISPQPSVPETILPVELRPPPAYFSQQLQLPPVAGGRQNAPPVPGPIPGITQGQYRPGDPRQQTNRNGNPRQQQQQQQQQQLRPNPHFHPHFQTFWNRVPAARQNDGIGRWLRLANTTTDQCLATLQLLPTDCGRFHIRGSCGLNSCRFQHNPSALNPTHVDSVVGLLSAGLQQAH